MAHQVGSYVDGMLLAISNLLVDTTTNLFCVVSGSNVQRCRVRVTVGIEHQDEQNGEGHADRHRCDDACRKRVSLVMCSAVVDNIRKLFVLPSTCDLLPKTIQDAHHCNACSCAAPWTNAIPQAASQQLQKPRN